VDSEYYLVDPATGYRVQRIGSEGVVEGFQDATNSAIRIPYDVALEAKSTENVDFSGNLSANEQSPSTQLLSSMIQYTSGGSAASTTTLLKDVDQASGLANGDTIAIGAVQRDGTTGSATFTITDVNTATMGDLVSQIASLFDANETAVSLINGEIRVQDAETGYSLTDVDLSYSGAGSLDLPPYFKILSAGGLAAKNINMEVFDSQGVGHVASATFVRSQANTWDLVVTSITGDVKLADRRIRQITFLADGAYGGLGGTTPDTPTFQMRFAHDPGNTRTLTMNFGTVGEVDGLSQFGGSSTVAPSGQDGYASGVLSSISVTREGVIRGVFTNGIRKNVAALKMATFQNPEGLETIGSNFALATANSGDPIPTKALSGGAGAVHGSSLEKSNVDVAEQFVNLIQAQNGYQSNARTIRVTNEMLQELTNLIR
jgi:flagellar hook protein FlgE